MSRLSQAWAALRGQPQIRMPAPESPRFSQPAWWGQFGVPHDLFLTTDEQLAVSVAWACIRAIADPIAASEIKVYEESDGVRKEDRESWLYWLLNVEPNPGYTAQAWGEVMATRAIATGNSYAHIRRDGASRPFSLQPLDPVRMVADDSSGSILYRYSDPLNGEVVLPESDVLHVRGPMTGGFYGDSPLARASAALALAKAQEDYATAYYANGAYPGVLLKPPATGGKSLTEDQKKTARAAWRGLFGGGPKKAKGIGIVDPGWSLEVVQTDAEKSQMVEARRYQVAEITRYFGVPGHLVGVPEASQGYGKNLAELGLGFVRQTLEPWAKRFGEEMRRKLLPGRRQGQSWFIDYDLSRLTKGDEEAVARAEEIALRDGVLKINEARSMRGLPSVKGGDVTLVNGTPLDQVLKPPAPPATVVAAGPKDTSATLEGHARRVRARSADMTAKGNSEEQIAAAVARLRRRAAGELGANGPEIEAALAAVEHGVSAAKVLAHLLEVVE